MSLSLEQLCRCSVAVDLGAARTRVYLKEVGLIVNQPTVAAVNTRTGSLIAVGSLAERMTGRTPGHIRVVRPVSGGTVVDIDIAQRMLRFFVGNKVRRAWRRKPLLRAAVCVSHDADPLARRAAAETLAGLGARRVELVDTLIAAAVGCGLPVERPEATMIVVCGATTTHIAVLSMGAIVAAEKIPVGGDIIDRAVLEHLRTRHELLLPGQSGHPLHEVLRGADPSVGGAEVHGRDVTTGLAKSVYVDAADVRAIVRSPLTGVLDAMRAVLRRCPPDLVADLADRGVVLAGGSARLTGLDELLAQGTGMHTHVADRPDLCAVEGLGALLEGKVQPLPLGPLSR
ncbi:rod shape-determining protein [Streptomyces sp. AC536]|uniref:rod shape-determining protein n=1 Tax=Streptomyces buecherae TaxID=2763006 RepID=UPI00164DEBD2|nr:rod shape-determining protein [Streptomyces buecherae]MBC3981199.1 rod shape-determining protein [Streptomyces buecherae]QNJ41549.1 rod shape-determining protein [Streptomyces buecherae]